MNEISIWWSIRETLHGRELLLGEFFDEKNDEEKVKSMLQYLSKFEKPLDIHEEFKSAEKASEHIEKANKDIESLSWISLIEIYTQAIIYAPPDSNELVQAYVNRSRALYNVGLYNDCWMDIERALQIDCPDHLKIDLNEQREKCCSAMNKTYMKYLRNRPIKKMDYEKFLPLVPDDNSKILQASGAIELAYSEKFGRQVVATRDIEAGEVLLVHKSYASIIEPHLMHKYCWHCSKRVWAGIPCHQCVSVIYCNESCRDDAWQQHHDIECPVIVAMLNAKMDIVELMSLRLTIKSLKEAKNFEILKENLEKINAIDDPVAKCFSENVFNSTKHASVYSLWRDFHDESSHALKASIILYFLAAITTIFDEKINNFELLLENEKTIFIGGLIMRHVAISVMNCITMCIDDDNGNSIERGGILNPLICLFNHSCDPMVIHYANGDMSAIISLQQIKKGEQIFYDYGSSFWDESTNERRNNLLEKFGFLCQCKPCMHNWGPHSRLFFPSRKMKSWPATIQTRLINIRTKYPSFMSMVSADITNKPLIISTTFDMINIYQESVKYYTKQIFELKALLHALYYSLRS